MDASTYVLCQSYVKKSLIGLGALKGASATIKSITETDEGNIVTFEWTANDGVTKRTSTMLVKDGEQGTSVTTAIVSPQNHLILTLSDGSTIDAGAMSVIAQLTEPITATENIGSITNGKTYTVGTQLQTIIKDMLIKYQKPTVSLSITPNATLYDAVTGEITEITLTAVVGKKTKPVTNVKFYVGGTLVNTVSTGVGEGGVFTYTYTPVSPIRSNIKFSASATDEQNETTTSEIQVTFIGKSYYGTVGADVSEPTEAQIKALNDVLKNTKTYVYSGITMDYGKVVYAYPSSLGNLTSIKDEINNINYYGSFAKSNLQIDGIAYTCYTQIDASQADGVSITFR